jgi:hypothetical protein
MITEILNKFKIFGKQDAGENSWRKFSEFSMTHEKHFYYSMKLQNPARGQTYGHSQPGMCVNLYLSLTVPISTKYLCCSFPPLIPKGK